MGYIERAQEREQLRKERMDLVTKEIMANQSYREWLYHMLRLGNAHILPFDKDSDRITSHNCGLQHAAKFFQNELNRASPASYWKMEQEENERITGEQEWHKKNRPQSQLTKQ